MENEVVLVLLDDIFQLSWPSLHVSIIVGGWLLNYQTPLLIDFWETRRERKELQIGIFGNFAICIYGKH